MKKAKIKKVAITRREWDDIGHRLDGRRAVQDVPGGYSVFTDEFCVICQNQPEDTCEHCPFCKAYGEHCGEVIYRHGLNSSGQTVFNPTGTISKAEFLRRLRALKADLRAHFYPWGGRK